MFPLNPTDRVLLLTLPPPDEVAELAEHLEGGLIVGFTSEADLGEARRALRDRVNVMILASSAESFPWQDGFFTVAVEFADRWEHPRQTAGEVARVLAPGGRLLLPAGFPASGDCLEAYFSGPDEHPGRFSSYLRIR
jgi:Methyltransferase domain